MGRMSELHTEIGNLLDEPTCERAITHARVGNLAHDLREVIKDLSRMRLDPVGAPFIAMEIDVLLECNEALSVLASSVLVPDERKIRLVSSDLVTGA